MTLNLVTFVGYNPVNYIQSNKKFLLSEMISVAARGVIQGAQHIANAVITGVQRVVILARLEGVCLKVFSSVIGEGSISNWSRGQALVSAAKNRDLAVVQALVKDGPISEQHCRLAIEEAAKHKCLVIINAIFEKEWVIEKDQGLAFLSAAKKGDLARVQTLLWNQPITNQDRLLGIHLAVANGYWSISQSIGW